MTDDEMDAAPVVVTGHFPGCSPHYPEKAEREAPQHLTRIDLGAGEWLDQCADCGGVIATGKEPR